MDLEKINVIRWANQLSIQRRTSLIRNKVLEKGSNLNSPISLKDII
ncbi:hypothetical protein [Clostridium coskatii]|nr:hypothetical protein [Clostridium coskatii]